MGPTRIYEHPQLELYRRWVEFGSPRDLTGFVDQPGVMGLLDEIDSRRERLDRDGFSMRAGPMDTRGYSVPEGSPEVTYTVVPGLTAR